MKTRILAAAVTLTALGIPAFAQDVVAPESPIFVTPQDELITQQVVQALANDSRLAGRIGVQTTDREVELSGIVTNASQSRQAERDAKSVYGVVHVRNTLSTRIGTSRN